MLILKSGKIELVKESDNSGIYCYFSNSLEEKKGDVFYVGSKAIKAWKWL